MRLEANYKKKTAKNTDRQRLNNMLLNKKCITESIKEEIRTYLEPKKNENTMIQNLWDKAKAVLRGKFIVTKAYHKKQEKPQINYLILHLKELEKEEQQNPKLVEGKKS